MTDPRYLDATQDQIVAEYWTYHFDDLRLSGRPEEEEHEDEEFDLDALVAKAADDPDGWVDVIKDDGAD